MTTFPTPDAPTPNAYLKPSELVDQTPPLSFGLLRVGKSQTQYGDQFYVSVAGPTDGDFTLTWKAATADDSQAVKDRDQLLGGLVDQTNAQTLQRGVRFSLYRTGGGGRVITIGPAVDGAVPFEQTTLDENAVGSESSTQARDALAPAPGADEDIPF